MEQEKILGLILEKLESIDNRVGGLEAGQKSLESRMGGMENRMGGMEKRMSALENRVEAMAEDVAITRSATNTLLKWAERTDSIVNVGLYE
mgnify:CR=1 FL=1